MVLAGAVALALLFLPQERAMAKGVFFDPDSPAGKEYALPLDQARDEAAGVGKSDGPAGERAPLFGEGVSAGQSGNGPRGGAGSNDADAAEGGGDATGQDERPHTGESQRRAKLSPLAAQGSDGYPLGSGVAWVAGVVALGGLLALGLRGLQRLRPT
jgi:hypothetical protein